MKATGRFTQAVGVGAIAVLMLVTLLPSAESVSTPPRTQIVTRTGAGPTLAAAEQDALQQIREDYWILSYTTKNGHCQYLEIFEITFCSITVEAIVLNRPFAGDAED